MTSSLVTRELVLQLVRERTFDAPIPTVTGEDPSRLSVIFDEVIVKERLVVEGGKSRTILTQFDDLLHLTKLLKLMLH